MLSSCYDAIYTYAFVIHQPQVMRGKSQKLKSKTPSSLIFDLAQNIEEKENRVWLRKFLKQPVKTLLKENE